ncbi:MAG: hypothetical protein HOV80_03350 [Polyangiaceae bacterium]|nr:hypothetical protein [Polyangiaceae bacterium]
MRERRDCHGSALGKLADQRKKVLESKAIATGTDAWSKRARAIALVVSDVIDVAQASAKPAPEKTAKTAKTESRLFPRTKLYVKRADAAVIMKGAAQSFGLAATGSDATASGYALLRAFIEGGADAFDAATLAEAKTFVGSVGTLLAESREMAGTGALFSVLGKAIGGDASVTPLFVGVSKALYEKGERQQADMVLLLALVVASVSEQTVHPTAIALADEQKSDVAWVLKFLRETKRLEKGERTEPASFGPGLDALLAKKCSTASSRAVTELSDAVDKHRSGDRDAARMALDAWLDRAEKDLSLPRVSFAFKQETETRVFHLTLEVGLGGPMLQGSNSFTFGAGAKSTGEPLLSLQTAVDSVDSKRARDDTARTFVQAAAVAGVMHFLAGDNTRGEIAAARVLAALTQRTRLYVPGVTDEPMMWADGARGTLAVLAQQAADAGRPFLAGALLEMVRTSVGGGAEPSDFAAVLDPLPNLIQHMPGVAPVVARAKKTLEVLPGGLPCGGRRSDKAALLRATCDTYANALALRIADATAALPTLESKGRGAACADFAAVDAFLQPASKGTYDPDRLQAAAKKLLDADKVFDAAVLLTRQRQPNHCSAPVIALIRSAAARLDRVATTRADLLSAAVNCEANSISPALVTDIGSLDTEIDRIGDSSRQLEVSLFAAKLALTHGSNEPLAVLVGKPDFVSRQRETGPGPLGFALLLDHASSALAGQPIRIKETASDVELLCGRIPPPDRAELCKLLEPLRVEKAAAAERRKAAEAALRRLLGP